LEGTLVRRFYRWDCPPGLLLGEFELGLLDPVEATSIREHLSSCPLCAGEIASLATFLSNDPMLVAPVVAPIPYRIAQPVLSNRQLVHEVQKRTLEQAQKTVQRILAILVLPQSGLALQRGPKNTQDPQGVPSGSKPLWPRRYTAEDISLALQLEPDTHQPGRMRLIGLVQRQGTDLASLQDVPVRLVDTSGFLQEQQLDDLGSFVFSSLAPAHYTLEVQLPDRVVVIEALPIHMLDERT
jgi:hypothetical protein